jgi:hypothetical protein
LHYKNKFRFKCGTGLQQRGLLLNLTGFPIMAIHTNYMNIATLNAANKIILFSTSKCTYTNLKINRLMGVKLIAALCCILMVAAMPSCKKYCYACNQYCSYCVNRSDSSLVIKVCEGKATAKLQVDSIKIVLQNSGYICNLLNDQTSVCNQSNGSSNRTITYYEKKNYYSEPQ